MPRSTVLCSPLSLNSSADISFSRPVIWPPRTCGPSSSSTTRRPSRAAWAAITAPPAPEPITHRSASIVVSPGAGGRTASGGKLRGTIARERATPMSACARGSS